MSVLSNTGIRMGASAGGDDPVYVEDVFSTYLYDGASGTNAINNGIDLDGEGGLVWCKKRDSSGYSHHMYDTERGVTKYISSNSTAADATTGTDFSSFNSNGFTLGTPDSIGSGLNATGGDYASWTFRKAPGFFDVVKYEGTGSAKTIAHNLGCVPGCIMVKNIDADTNWEVYHKNSHSSLAHRTRLELNQSGAAATNDSYWNDTAPTSTVFSVSNGFANTNGETYVAYLFAAGDDSDAQVFGDDEDEAIIKCGSYTGDSGTIPNPVNNVGFEPQWVLIKKSSGGGDWCLYDVMRPTGVGGKQLNANDSTGEVTENGFEVNSTGFHLLNGGGQYNTTGDTYIYVAIRRGPMKTPEDATKVFAIDTGSGSATIPTFDSGFPVDTALTRRLDVNHNAFASRLAGSQWLRTNGTDNESSDTDFIWDSNTGHGKNWSSSYYSWMFRRAPGFFDTVAYTGDSTARLQTHNLGVIPEMWIVKSRSYSDNWLCYHKDAGSVNHRGWLDTDNAWSSSSGVFAAGGTVSTTAFPLGSDGQVNDSGKTYIAFLFATTAGVSKVGGYTGTGNDINVDCGFTAGARFVLIKRTDADGGWWMFDTARGIVSGNDPGLEINSTNAENTTIDFLDPLSSGFTVAVSGIDALNASGGNYIYLAIA